MGQQETQSATEEEKSSRLCRQRRKSRDSRMERRWQQVGGAEDETRRNICLFGEQQRVTALRSPCKHTEADHLNRRLIVSVTASKKKEFN